MKNLLWVSDGSLKSWQIARLTAGRKLRLTLTLSRFDQWLRLSLCKGPNKVGVSHPSSDDWNRSSVRNIAFSSIQMMGKIRKRSNSEDYDMLFVRCTEEREPALWNLIAESLGL
jgi:hypothetical protein